jgi:hypothetical protein
VLAAERTLLLLLLLLPKRERKKEREGEGTPRGGEGWLDTTLR